VQLLLAVAAVWLVEVSALPLELHDVPSTLLQEAVEVVAVPSATEAAKSKQDEAKAKVAAALEDAHKNGIPASTPGVKTTQSTNSAAPVAQSVAPTKPAPSPPSPQPSTDGNTKVSAPSAPSVSTIAKSKTAPAVPEQKYTNRDKQPGQAGWLRQQAEKGDKTADYQIQSIQTKLTSIRAAKYREAAGSQNLLKAAKEASDAASAMASQVRKEDAKKVSRAEQRVRKLTARRARLHAKLLVATKQKGKQHLVKKIEKKIANTQIKLARVKGQRERLFAKASSMGKAVNKLLAKAGVIQGRAKEEAIADEDGSTRLQRAMYENAKAQLALKAFEKETKVTNAQAKDDQKMKQNAEKVEEDNKKKVKDAKKQFQEANRKAEETEHQQALKKSEEFGKKHKAVADESVSPVKVKKLTSKTQPLTSDAKKKSTPAPAPPSSTVTVAQDVPSTKKEANKKADELTAFAKGAKTVEATLKAAAAKNHAAKLPTSLKQ